MAMEIIIPAIFAVFAAGAACASPVESRSDAQDPGLYLAHGSSLALPVAIRVSAQGPSFCTGRISSIDPLSMYHILLVDFIFLISSLYATGYFKDRIIAGRLSTSFVKRYCMLWQAFQAMLLLVLMSNNIGVMWVALEATTLVSAFLILSDSDALSIEAMWKYLLICSVGIVFAFMGTVFTVAAAGNYRRATRSISSAS